MCWVVTSGDFRMSFELIDDATDLMDWFDFFHVPFALTYEERQDASADTEGWREAGDW